MVNLRNKPNYCAWSAFNLFYISCHFSVDLGDVSLKKFIATFMTRVLLPRKRKFQRPLNKPPSWIVLLKVRT